MYYIPERDIALTWGTQDNSLIINSESTILTGFQLYVNTDWINLREKLVKTVIVYTGNEEDTINVCAIDYISPPFMTLQPFLAGGATTTTTAGSSPQKQTSIIPNSSSTTPSKDIIFANDECILTHFLKEYQTDSFTIKELDNGGKIFTGSPKQFTSQTSTFYQIPKGDFMASIDLIQLNFNLKKLGFGERSGSLLKEPSEMQIERVCNYFSIKISLSSNFIRLFSKICILIQQSLVFLDCLPLSFPIDGLLCSFTTEALQHYKFNIIDSDFGDSKLCSKYVIQSMISQIMFLKSKLDQFGYTLNQDPFSYPEKLHRRIKQFQKASHISVSKVFDPETTELLKKTVEGKSRLTQPVAAVSSKVSNLKNKVEEFAGLRYDGQLLERENPSYESLDLRYMDTADLCYHLKSIMKREEELAEKIEKKRKKISRKDKRMSLIESTFEDGKSIPSRMFKGIKHSTTKTLGVFASKGKNMTKNVTMGMKHFMQGASSSSASDGSVTDFGEEDDADEQQDPVYISNKGCSSHPIPTSITDTDNVGRTSSKQKLSISTSPDGVPTTSLSPISPIPDDISSSVSPLPQVESLMVIPGLSMSNSFDGNGNPKPFPFIPDNNLSNMSYYDPISRGSPSYDNFAGGYSSFQEFNPKFSSLQAENQSQLFLSTDALHSIGSNAHYSSFNNLSVPSQGYRSSQDQMDLSPNRESFLSSPISRGPELSSPELDYGNVNNYTPIDMETMVSKNPYEIHSSVLNSATTLLKKMNNLDQFIQQMTDINKKFDSTLSSFSEKTQSMKLNSESLLSRLDILQHEQKQLEKVLDTVVRNEGLKAKYSLDMLMEKTKDFDEFVSSSLGRVRKIETKLSLDSKKEVK